MKKKLRELADVAGYLAVQLREFIPSAENIIVDETDPLGYAILHLEPEHVLCKCGTEMEKKETKEDYQKWVCPKCGLTLIVLGQKRGGKVS